MRIRKAILICVLVLATAAGLLRFETLSSAAGHAPADECQLFSCIFDDAADGD